MRTDAYGGHTSVSRDGSTRVVAPRRGVTSACPGHRWAVRCWSPWSCSLHSTPPRRARCCPRSCPARCSTLALTLRYVTGQAAQVGGFVLGGLLVAALSPSAALALDAASFLVSALSSGGGWRSGRCRPRRSRTRSPGRSDAREALRTVLRDHRRRQLVCTAWLLGCFVLPEALAVPYAQQLDMDTAAAGLLMAADPAGSVLGGRRSPGSSLSGTQADDPARSRWRLLSRWRRAVWSPASSPR